MLPFSRATPKAKFFFICALFASSIPGFGTAAPTSAEAAPNVVQPESEGFAAERLKRIAAFLERRIEQKRIAGAVALVARRRRVVYFESFGSSDVEAHSAMDRSAAFRICSMTKPVVAVATLMLVEDGRIRLSDPVGRFLPAFRELKVAELDLTGRAAGSPASIDQPAGRPITIWDLLTHTSGVGSGPASALAIRKLHRAPGATLADFIPSLASAPLDFQPGSRWHYSGGAGFDILGRIVEIASGRPLNIFLEERLLRPLGMTSSSFVIDPDLQRRLAAVYEDTGHGLRRIADQIYPTDSAYFSGSAGLISSVQDYFHFAQMLCDEGRWRGQQVLSPRAIELMASVQIPDSLPGREPGEGWGLGVRVISNGPLTGTLLSTGSYGWSGVYGTHFWIDPGQHIVAILMLQQSNAGGSGAATAREFETAVMQAVVTLNTNQNPIR